MSEHKEAKIAYFMMISRCQRDPAINILEKQQWKIDKALNYFFEQNDRDRDQISIKSDEQIHRLIRSPQSKAPTIIIPSMIEFQRFIESFDCAMNMKLLENSSKMMTLAMKYATHRSPTMSTEDLEHWQIHIRIDYTRLQTLLDHDMCAPLLWIEHFQHLLEGNHCQLFDCDYMFNIFQ